MAFVSASILGFRVRGVVRTRIKHKAPSACVHVHQSKAYRGQYGWHYVSQQSLDRGAPKMVEIPSAEPPRRRATLDSAQRDYFNSFYREAQDTFLHSGGSDLNSMCTADQHIMAMLETGGRPSTPEQVQNTAAVAYDVTSSPVSSQDPHLNTRPDEPIQSAEDQSTKDNGKPSPRDTSGGEADGEFSQNEEFIPDAYPPAFVEINEDGPWEKEPWGPHDGSFYRESDIEYQDLYWRYHVITDVEEYRISTIPDDFLGSGTRNAWTPEVRAAYGYYKAYESLSVSLRYESLDSVNKKEGYVFFQQLIWLTSLRAGQKRLEVLRKWPSAFELDNGTAGHWHIIASCFDRAESARQRARDVALATRSASIEDTSGDFRVEIYAATTKDLQEQGTRASTALATHILKELLTIPFTGPHALPEWWTVPVITAARQGRPVYAINPVQYEQMRVANDRLKADMEQAFNDRFRPETIQSCPQAALPYLPPLKADVANSFLPNINDDNLCMKCLSNTFSILAGFWADADKPNRRI